MDLKNVCVIANGYAEEMMAAKLMHEMRAELEKHDQLNEYQLIGGSLVSSGKWFQEARFPTFFSGGMTPSGGFPTNSFAGFFADLGAGAFLTPFKFIKVLKKWRYYNLNTVIVVGDFLLMMLVVPALKNSNIPMVFIPTAKSDYIRSHFKIEKKLIKKYAAMTFPRDKITSDDFSEYGITSECYGNLMQDLLDQKAVLIKSPDPIIALLPGSRQESYGNLEIMLKFILGVKDVVHWAFVQASSLDPDTVNYIFKYKNWTYGGLENNIPFWTKDHHRVYCYPNTMFNSVALSCMFAISLAGTAGEQIAGLGKPVIGFKGTGPQSSVSRMEDYEKLLGEAFIYERDCPIGLVHTIERLLHNKQEREDRGNVGLERMGNPGATKKIAKYIIDNILNLKNTEGN